MSHDKLKFHAPGPGGGGGCWRTNVSPSRRPGSGPNFPAVSQVSRSAKRWLIGAILLTTDIAGESRAQGHPLHHRLITPMSDSASTANTRPIAINTGVRR